MKHPIPLRYRLRKGGCPKQPDDFRDIKLGDTPYVPDPNCPSWEQGFDNEITHDRLKREHQGSSLSCVGQGWSKYLEMLNLIEEGLVDLSARDIYSQIYLPQGGAYIRDGAKIAVNKGNCLETLLTSYQNENPPTEAFMRLRSDATPQTIADALTYRSKKFVYLDTSYPLTDEDWENIRQVIWQFGGFVSGYKRHCMYVSGYYLKNGKKTIRFINSYGENSDQEYQGDKEIYDISFLMDLPNPPNKINMLKIVGNKTTRKQYLLGKDRKLRWIFNETLLNELHNSGVADKFEVEWKDNLDRYEVGDIWAIIK